MMIRSSDSPDNRDDLLWQYKLYYDALGEVMGKLTKGLTRERFDLVLKTLGLADDMPLVLRNDRLRAAIYDYAVFSDRLEGRTIFQQWLEDFHQHQGDAVKAATSRLVEALVENRFSVFDVEAVREGLGVDVRDVLCEQRLFVMDRLMSSNWRQGARFASRLIILPQFAMFT